MSTGFLDIAVTPSVRSVQRAMGSDELWQARLARHAPSRLTARERAFITARDSFYMASVGETGWPYVQHRGGPAGFVRVLDDATLGFVDFRGNRQYVSTGNLSNDDRVSMFFMDYPNRARLKVYGRARLVEVDEPVVAERLALHGYKGRVERGVMVHVEAFDWNCPQHITPRYTVEQIEQIIAPLQSRIAELEAGIA